jgi:predicted LPLAT superfamily acyltransferase
VVLAFGAKTGWTTYRFHAARFDMPQGRASQAGAEAARRYAAALAGWVSAHPFQWFNFYDFWAPPRWEPAPASPEAT